MTPPPQAPPADPDLRRRSAHWMLLRQSGISFGIGLGVIFVVGLADPEMYTPLNFLVGGAVGWLVGSGAFALILGSSSLFGGAGLWLPAGFFGLMGLVVGLIFFTVERLRERLRASVARIKEQEFAEKELELARSIQRRLLPPGEVSGEGYRLAARNLPARFVAGDFYDVYRTGGVLGLAVGDVAGKGMGAALIMASAKAMIPLVAAERPADETLGELNSRLLRDLAPREFVALLVFHLDLRSGRFELANAGLPDPYLLRPGTAARTLEAPGPRLPLGLRPGVSYQRLAGHLAPGDRVLFFTDGLPEAPVADGEPVGYTALEALTERLREDEPGLALSRLVDELSVRTQAREDDWTALLLEVLPTR